METKFGPYIRTKRKQAGIPLNTFCKMLGLSSAYISHVERNLRPAPSDQIIIEMACALGLDTDEAFSMADRLPPDMRSHVSEVIQLYREFRELGV